MCMCDFVQLVCIHFSSGATVNVFVCVKSGGEIPLLFPFIRQRLSFLYEVTLGQPEYIYRGTFMNSGERALTSNYRPHSSVPPLKTLLNCINKCGEAKGDRQCWPSP